VQVGSGAAGYPRRGLFEMIGRILVDP